MQIFSAKVPYHFKHNYVNKITMSTVEIKNNFVMNNKMKQ